MNASDIIGGNKLFSAFGAWPSFHDAEVLRLELVRNTPSDPILKLTLYIFTTLDETNEQSQYKLTNRHAVTFLFHNVRDVSIEGFNEQNVIWDLVMERHQDVITVKIPTIYGLDGEFSCDAVEIEGCIPFEGSKGTA